MNRIYQGRVKRIEILNDAKQRDVLANFDEQALKHESGNPLWEHHRIFQDAVNYYLVALAALADPQYAQGNRLIKNLPKRLSAAWNQFPRSTSGQARSLKVSLTDWLGLGPESTFEDACAEILKGNEVDANQRVEALLEFIDSKEMKNGEIRNAAKNIKWFVLKTHNKNYPASYGVVLQSWAKSRLPVWISETRTDDDICWLRDGLKPEFFSKLNASSPYISGSAAIEALKERVEKFDFSKSKQLKGKLLKQLKKLDGDLSFPVPANGALKKPKVDRFSAFCFFKFISASKDTFELLASFFEKPKAKDIERFRGTIDEPPRQIGKALM